MVECFQNAVVSTVFEFSMFHNIVFILVLCTCR